MAEKKIIEIEVPIGDAIQTIDQLTNKINELKAAEGLEGKQRVQNELKIKEYTRQRRVLMNEVGNEIKGTQQAMGAYQKLQAEYSKAAQKAKDLAIAQGAGSEAAKKAAAAANEMQQRLKEADASVGQYQRNVGNYKDALSGLPGPMGQAVNSVKQLSAAFKLLLLNPVALAIMSIVGALALLYKAFTSTDKGATMLAGVMKALSNVMDVLLDRTMSFFKILGSIVTFDFKGMRQNAQDAFGGVATAIRDAAAAGYEYEQQMDSIKDREAASLIRSAKLRAEIETLKNQAKDVTKTYAERIRVNDLAMKKSIELFNIEKGFQKERFIAERNNIASMIQVQGMSVQQKRQQIDEWLKLDDRQIEQYSKNNARFREFYNKNEAAFQALQKLKAEDFQKDSEFQRETRRLQTESFSFRSQLLKEEQAASGKATEQRTARLEQERRARENMITELKVQVKAFNVEMDKLNAIVQQQMGQHFENLKKQLNDTIPVLKQNFENYLSNKLDIARLSGQGEADAQLEIMRWQMQQELSVKDLTEQQKLAITEKYKLQEQKLNETIIMNNVSMLGSALGDISGLLEEGSKEQKAISSAQVAVDTITAAFAAYKAGVASGLPTPFNFIAGGTLAAIASAKGAKAIKDIWAVDEKGTTSAPTQTATAIPDLTSKMSSPLNRGVSGVAAMGGANVITSAPSTGSTLLNYDAMANAMTSAMSKMPAPVVSVVELNKKSNNVKLIENISTYSRK